MGKNNKKSTKKTRVALSVKANEIFGGLDELNAHLDKLGLGQYLTMEEAIKKICSLWLNIVDFVYGIFNPFKNKKELIKYTREHEKYFNKKDAKVSGLSQLLIRMSLHSV